MCVLLQKLNISTYKREAFLKHHVGEVALYSRNIPLVRNSLLLYNKSFIGGGGGGGEFCKKEVLLARFHENLFFAVRNT